MSRVRRRMFESLCRKGPQAGHLELTVWRRWPGGTANVFEASVGAVLRSDLKQYDCDVETMPPLGD